MPRLPRPLFHRASKIHHLLPLLLPPCRTLSSALNELRWLRQHTLAHPHPQKFPSAYLGHLCHERRRGKPLQYILGTQPFGDLEILCKPGVLIPRPETEAHVTHLAALLAASIPPLSPNPLRILDLCTGTGCIPLLLSALLSPCIPSLNIHALDISPQAISLASQNLRHNIREENIFSSTAQQIKFECADIFNAETFAGRGEWDVLVSNPPYVSPRGYERDTSRSVRNWEPKLALVPGENHRASVVGRGDDEADAAKGDEFYPRLLKIAEEVKAKVVWLEVADTEQAQRVIWMATRSRWWEGCEIWKDWPDGGTSGEWEHFKVGGSKVRVVGEGNGRAVVLRRSAWGRTIFKKIEETSVSAI